jgi:D-methionine transport system ATP-binding protein
MHALKGVTFSIQDDSITGIIGMSGAGKSTLLRALAGLVVPDVGVIEIDGKTVHEMSAPNLRLLRKSIGVVFQGYQLLMQKTVYKNIAFPLEIAGVDELEITERVRQLIDLVGLQGKEHQYPAKLSGGQMQRVAIARAMATKPKILLCDEPTSALDAITTKEIIGLLSMLNKTEHVTIIIVTHEVGIVRQICNQVIVLDQGHIMESGDVLTIFEKPQSSITKLLLGKEVSL